jgi:hypothetical protein
VGIVIVVLIIIVIDGDDELSRWLGRRLIGLNFLGLVFEHSRRRRAVFGG